MKLIGLIGNLIYSMKYHIDALEHSIGTSSGFFSDVADENGMEGRQG